MSQRTLTDVEIANLQLQTEPNPDVPESSTQSAPPPTVFDMGMEVPGMLESALIGAGRTADKIGTGVQNLFVDDAEAERLQQEQAEKDRLFAQLSDERPASTMVGETLPYFAVPLGIGGQAVGKALQGTSKIPGLGGLLNVGGKVRGSTLADAGLTGTALGGITYDDNQAGQAVESGVTGLLGDLAGRFVGRVVQPVQSRLEGQAKELAEWGRSMGYKLLPSEQTGSIPLKQIEASMRSTPSTSAPMQNIADFNQKKHNQIALRSIGEDGDEVSAEVLGKAHKELGNEFQRLTRNEEIELDYGESGDILDSINNNLERYGIDSIDEIEGGIKYVDKVLNKLRDGDIISGENYQRLQSSASNNAQRMLRSTTSQDIENGFLNAAIKDALDDAVERSLGTDKLKAFRDVRQKWRNKLFLENAGVVNTGTGDVSPATLANVLARRDISGFRRGNNKSDLYQLGRFGQAFKDIADSGTATRQIVGNLERDLKLGTLAAGAGLLGGNLADQALDPTTLGLLASAPIMSSTLMNMLSRGYVAGGGYPLKQGLIPPITGNIPPRFLQTGRQLLGRAAPVTGLPLVSGGLLEE